MSRTDKGSIQTLGHLSKTTRQIHLNRQCLLSAVFTEKPDPHQSTGPLCSVYYLYIYVIVRRILHIKSEIFIAKCLDKLVMNLFYSLISARGLFPR